MFILLQNAAVSRLWLKLLLVRDWLEICLGVEERAFPGRRARIVVLILAVWRPDMELPEAVHSGFCGATAPAVMRLVRQQGAVRALLPEPLYFHQVYIFAV